MFFGRFYFYPRSPYGERLNPLETLVILSKFLSTLSLRRATYAFSCLFMTSQISIHALLTESDELSSSFLDIDYCISIHALLTESDFGLPATSLAHREFLSTLSLRRATSSWVCKGISYFIFLSTLSLRRATNTFF